MNRGVDILREYLDDEPRNTEFDLRSTPSPAKTVVGGAHHDDSSSKNRRLTVDSSVAPQTPLQTPLATQSRTTPGPLTPFSPLFRRQHSEHWRDEAMMEVSLELCRRVSVVILVDSLKKDSKGHQCLFPYTKDGRTSHRELIVVNPTAFGTLIPTDTTMETARLVGKLADTEDWVRSYKFHNVVFDEPAHHLVTLVQALANDLTTPRSDAQRLVVGLSHGNTACQTNQLFGHAAQKSVAQTFAVPRDLAASEILSHFGLVGLVLHLIMSSHSGVCTLSLMEIVDDERLYDLLLPKPYSSRNETQAKVSSTDGSCKVVGLSEAKINSLSQIGHLIRRAFGAALHPLRRTSRGHILATISLIPDSSKPHQRRCCRVLDLIAPTSNAKSSSSVRKSVSALGGILRSMLLREAGTYRPMAFRDALLTKVLQQNFIPSNSRVVILSNVSSLKKHFETSMASLRFLNQLLARPGQPVHSPFNEKSANAKSGSAAVDDINFEGQESRLLQEMLSDPRQRLAKMAGKRQKVRPAVSPPINYVTTTYADPYESTSESDSIVEVMSNDITPLARNNSKNGSSNNHEVTGMTDDHHTNNIGGRDGDAAEGINNLTRQYSHGDDYDFLVDHADIGQEPNSNFWGTDDSSWEEAQEETRRPTVLDADQVDHFPEHDDGLGLSRDQQARYIPTEEVANLDGFSPTHKDLASSRTPKEVAPSVERRVSFTNNDYSAGFKGKPDLNTLREDTMASDSESLLVSDHDLFRPSDSHDDIEGGLTRSPEATYNISEEIDQLLRSSNTDMLQSKPRDTGNQITHPKFTNGSGQVPEQKDNFRKLSEPTDEILDYGHARTNHESPDSYGASVDRLDDSKPSIFSRQVPEQVGADMEEISYGDSIPTQRTSELEDYELRPKSYSISNEECDKSKQTCDDVRIPLQRKQGTSLADTIYKGTTTSRSNHEGTSVASDHSVTSDHRREIEATQFTVSPSTRYNDLGLPVGNYQREVEMLGRVESTVPQHHNGLRNHNQQTESAVPAHHKDLSFHVGGIEAGRRAEFTASTLLEDLHDHDQPTELPSSMNHEDIEYRSNETKPRRRAQPTASTHHEDPGNNLRDVEPRGPVASSDSKYSEGARYHPRQIESPWRDELTVLAHHADLGFQRRKTEPSLGADYGASTRHEDLGQRGGETDSYGPASAHSSDLGYRQRETQSQSKTISPASSHHGDLEYHHGEIQSQGLTGSTALAHDGDLDYQRAVVESHRRAQSISSARHQDTDYPWRETESIPRAECVAPTQHQSELGCDHNDILAQGQTDSIAPARLRDPDSLNGGNPTEIEPRRRTASPAPAAHEDLSIRNRGDNRSELVHREQTRHLDFTRGRSTELGRSPQESPRLSSQQLIQEKYNRSPTARSSQGLTSRNFDEQERDPLVRHRGNITAGKPFEDPEPFSSNGELPLVEYTAENSNSDNYIFRDDGRLSSNGGVSPSTNQLENGTTNNTWSANLPSGHSSQRAALYSRSASCDDSKFAGEHVSLLSSNCSSDTSQHLGNRIDALEKIRRCGNETSGDKTACETEEKVVNKFLQKSDGEALTHRGLISKPREHEAIGYFSPTSVDSNSSPALCDRELIRSPKHGITLNELDEEQGEQQNSESNSGPGSDVRGSEAIEGSKTMYRRFPRDDDTGFQKHLNSDFTKSESLKRMSSSQQHDATRLSTDETHKKLERLEKSRVGDRAVGESDLKLPFANTDGRSMLSEQEEISISSLPMLPEKNKRDSLVQVHTNQRISSIITKEIRTVKGVSAATTDYYIPPDSPTTPSRLGSDSHEVSTLHEESLPQNSQLPVSGNHVSKHGRASDRNNADALEREKVSVGAASVPHKQVRSRAFEGPNPHTGSKTVISSVFSASQTEVSHEGAVNQSGHTGKTSFGKRTLARSGLDSFEYDCEQHSTYELPTDSRCTQQTIGLKSSDAIPEEQERRTAGEPETLARKAIVHDEQTRVHKVQGRHENAEGSSYPSRASNKPNHPSTTEALQRLKSFEAENGIHSHYFRPSEISVPRSNPNSPSRSHHSVTQNSAATEKSAIEEIDELQAAVDKVKQTNLSVWKESLSSIDNLRYLQTSQLNELARTRSERNRATDELERLKNELGSLSENHSLSLQQKIEEQQTMKEEIAQGNKVKEEVVKIAEAAIAMQAELEKKVDELEGQIRYLREASVPKQKYESLEVASGDLTNQVDALKQEIASLRSQLKGRDDALGRANGSLSRYKQQLELMANENRNSRALIETMRTETETFQKCESELKIAQRDILRLRDESQLRLRDEQEKQADLMRQLESSRVEVVRIPQLESELEKVRLQVTEYQTNLGATKETASLLETTKADLSLRLQSTTEELERRVSDVNELTTCTKRLLEEKEYDRARISDMESALSSFQLDTRSRVEQILQKRNEAMSLLSRAVTENRTLEETNKRLSDSHDRLQSQHNDAMRRLAAQERQDGGTRTRGFVRDSQAVGNRSIGARDRIPFQRPQRTVGSPPRHVEADSDSREPSMMRSNWESDEINHSRETFMTHERAGEAGLSRTQELAAALAMSARSRLGSMGGGFDGLDEKIYKLEDEKDAEIAALRARIKALERQNTRKYR